MKVNNQFTINLLDRKQPEKRQKYFASGLYVYPLPHSPYKTNKFNHKAVSFQLTEVILWMSL